MALLSKEEDKEAVEVDGGIGGAFAVHLLRLLRLLACVEKSLAEKCGRKRRQRRHVNMVRLDGHGMKNGGIVDRLRIRGETGVKVRSVGSVHSSPKGPK